MRLTFTSMRLRGMRTGNKTGNLSCYVQCGFFYLTIFFLDFQDTITPLRAFHKLLEIFQKVSRDCSKSCSKVSQKTIKSCFLKRKLLTSCSKNKNVFWSDSKISKSYNKCKILKHFCAILRRNQRC